jgi:hypothetical protein
MIRLIYLGIILMSLYVPVYANTGALNIALPGMYGSYQSDSFRADGMDCSMAIGSGTNVEFGVLGIISRPNNVVTTDPFANQTKDVGVYGRITIPIGAPKTRLDCSHLYQIELRKRQIELEKLERELQNLKNMRFENNVNKPRE